MKEIPLTRNQVAIVDDHWYEYLMQWKWQARWDRHTKGYYAQRSDRTSGKHKIIHMHRLIANTPDGMFCDHINHNTLDNRESMLRNVTPSQSMMNQRLRSDNTSGITGIHKRKDRNSYTVRLNINGKRIIDKQYPTLEEAKNARLEAINKYFGEFTNQISKLEAEC